MFNLSPALCCFPWLDVLMHNNIIISPMGPSLIQPRYDSGYLHAGICLALKIEVTKFFGTTLSGFEIIHLVITLCIICSISICDAYQKGMYDSQNIVGYPYQIRYAKGLPTAIRFLSQSVYLFVCDGCLNTMRSLHILRPETVAMLKSRALLEHRTWCYYCTEIFFHRRKHRTNHNTFIKSFF